MFAYVKYGKRFAVYAEASKELGMRPIFRLNTCNGETILNLPYAQVILTPGRKLKAGPENDGEKQDKNFPPPSERTPED
jgi:hypothetical protein